MPEKTSAPLPLDGPPLHVEVEPGAEIVLRGSFHSSFDGTTIDAATTSWPPETPGGASVVPSGIVDLEAGGFHMTSRDPVTHEVHAISTGKGGEVCAALHSTAPCLPLRLDRLALERRPVGIPTAELSHSLQGGILVEGLPPPVVPPVVFPYVGIALSILGAGIVAILAAGMMRRRAGSPEGKLAALLGRVEGKLGQSDAVLAAPLRPAVETARKSLRKRRIDPSSAEGKRVEAVLLRVEARLDASASDARSAAEQEAADELVHEMESALEAADEAGLAAGRPRAARDRAPSGPLQRR
jgi:hypothetical protein